MLSNLCLSETSVEDNIRLTRANVPNLRSKALEKHSHACLPIAIILSFKKRWFSKRPHGRTEVLNRLRY